MNTCKEENEFKELIISQFMQWKNCIWTSKVKLQVTEDNINRVTAVQDSWSASLFFPSHTFLLVSGTNSTITNPCQERPSRYETHTQLQCPTWQLPCCFPLCFHSYPRVWLLLEAPYVVMYTFLHWHMNTQVLMLLANVMDKRGINNKNLQLQIKL